LLLVVLVSIPTAWRAAKAREAGEAGSENEDEDAEATTDGDGKPGEMKPDNLR